MKAIVYVFVPPDEPDEPPHAVNASSTAATPAKPARERLDQMRTKSLDITTSFFPYANEPLLTR